MDRGRGAFEAILSSISLSFMNCFCMGVCFDVFQFPANLEDIGRLEDAAGSLEARCLHSMGRIGEENYRKYRC